MKRFTFSILASIALCLTAFAQQTERNSKNVLTATFTSASGTAYTAGDSVGTAQTLTNVTGTASGTGTIVRLEGIKVQDSAAQAKSFTVYFFDGDAPSLTDNAAFAWGTSLDNLVGQVTIDAADYETVNSKSTSDRNLLNCWMKLANTSANLSVAVVTKDTPTYGNGGTLKLTFYFSY